MKAKIKNLTDEILAALAPIFAKHQDYDDIFNAMTLVMARVVQATPDKGNELLIIEDAYTATKHALNEFLKLEQAYEEEQTAKKAKLDEGIVAFDQFARPEQPVIEPGSAGDYPDNPNQNIAKTVAPFNAEKLAAENDLRDYYQNRCTLEDMEARRERRAALQDIKDIQAEEAE